MSRRTRGLIVPDCWLLLAERPEVTTIERLSLRGELHAPMRRYRRRDSEWIVGSLETCLQWGRGLGSGRIEGRGLEERAGGRIV
jgi:hypothetical protein